MATLDELVVRIKADASQLERELKRTGAVAQTESRKMESAFGGVNKSLGGVSAGLFNVRSALAPVVGALGAGQVIRMSDAWKMLEGRLRVVTSSATELASVQSRLMDIANRTGTDITANATLYARLALSSRELGKSQSDLMRLTEAVGNAISISGGSAGTSAGAMLQFSQAIGAGIVRAEEFNSILEGAPRLAQAAADGLDRAGGSVARLRTMIINGEVSSREFFDAISSQSEKLAAEFAKTEGVVARSFTRLQNSLTQLIGQSATVNAATGSIAFGIDAVAENLDTLADVATFAAAVFGTRMAFAFTTATAAAIATQAQAARTSAAYLGMATSAGVATTATRAMSGAMAWFGGPIGVAVAVLAGAVALFATRTTESEKAARAHNEAMQKAIQIQDDLTRLTGDAAEAKKKERDELIANTKAKIANAEAALALAEAEAKQLNVHNALLVSRTGMSPTGGPLTLGEMEGISAAKAELARMKGELDELSGAFGLGGDSGGGSGGGSAADGSKSKGVELPDYDAGAFENYLRDLQDETEALSKSDRELAIRKALTEAQTAAQKDYADGIRDTSLLYEDEKQKIEDLAGSYYDLERSIQDNRETAREWQKELADGLTDIVMNFDSATDAARNFFNEIASQMLKKSVTGPLAEGIMGAIGGGGGMGSILGGIFGGNSLGQAAGFATQGGYGPFQGFADGGNPPVGVPSIVGERGPEIFVPRSAGTVIPNHALGGTSVTVVQHNTFGSGVSRSEIAGMLPALAEASKQAVFAEIQKGGSAAQIVGRRS